MSGVDTVAETDAEARSTGAEDVAWDLEDLVGGHGADGVRRLLDEALDDARALTAASKGTFAESGPAELAGALDALAALQEKARRAVGYAHLRFAVDTTDPVRGALLQQAQEAAARLSAELVWFDLEWSDLDEDRAAALMADPAVDAYRHHLELVRAHRPHVLTEPEERLLATIAPTGRGAWTRLFAQETSSIEVPLDGESLSLPSALARLSHPDRDVRRTVAQAVTDALQPGLRTRVYIFNTLLADRRIQDDLRHYPTWISAFNQGNETTDAAVTALVDAVVARYDLPQRWYRLKASVLGLDRLADFDRYASVGETESFIDWPRATEIVRDAYASFSPELASIVGRFLDEGWIDAPTRPGKRGGAFCSYTVPSHHPYVFLNYAATPSDVMTLAHELGHGVHGYLARGNSLFQQSTPLTVAETASVFGETVTFERLLALVADPAERFALLAQNIEGSIATVFRQVAMNRFEQAVHTHRRDVGELSAEDFGDHWAATQGDLFGDSMDVSTGYRDWWSYIPHFIDTPGYVYSYAFGQLLALSVYARYRDRGDAFVPRYLDMLRAGGSMWPEQLADMVDCDLADPGFWESGLGLIEAQVDAAEAAAAAAGRL